MMRKISNLVEKLEKISRRFEPHVCDKFNQSACGVD